MGKLQVFEVLFENNKDVFKPGDSVRGEVRIVLSGEKGDIRGIKVVCKGKSFTHWSESRGSRKHRRTVHYTWKVSFFKQEITLRGAGKNNTVASRMQLPAGDHRFPFQFQLPVQAMPPPFEGTVGWVRYYMKATIDRPWKFDHHVQRFFSIWTVKDLNLIQNIFMMPSGVVEKTVCCCCCESGPVSLRATIDKSGYAPGESILVTVELNNQSGRDIISLVASLMQYVKYRARHGGTTHTRTSNKRVAELIFEGCNDCEACTYSQKPMIIPPIPPNSFENCPNIDVTYIVKVEADVSGTPIDAVVKLPLIIGTVPAIRHLAQQAQPGYPPHQGHRKGHHKGHSFTVPPHQVGTGYQNQPQPSAPSLPPPSYEMAVEGPHAIEGKKGAFGTTMYAPRYPYYNQGAMSENYGQGTGAGGYSAGPVVTQPQQRANSPGLEPYQPRQQPAHSELVQLHEYPPV